MLTLDLESNSKFNVKVDSQIHTYYLYLENTNDAFVPPNPKLLDRATSTSLS
jgi:hypothetical protein